jgi:triosephosphate isomerase
LIKNKIHVIFCVDFEINFKDPIVNGISNNQENLLENLFKHLIEKLLTDVFPDDIVNYLIIAYEPVSIIGSSQALSNNEIADKCKQIRSIIGNLNLDTEKIRILYAAGANKNNIRGIISNEDVDGVLVGKASLEPNEFYSLLMIADEINKLNQ